MKLNSNEELSWTFNELKSFKYIAEKKTLNAKSSGDATPQATSGLKVACEMMGLKRHHKQQSRYIEPIQRLINN